FFITLTSIILLHPLSLHDALPICLDNTEILHLAECECEDVCGAGQLEVSGFGPTTSSSTGCRAKILVLASKFNISQLDVLHVAHREAAGRHGAIVNQHEASLLGCHRPGLANKIIIRR